MKNDDVNESTRPSHEVANTGDLITESRSLIERARRVLEEPEHESTNQTQKDRKVRHTMSTELTPQMAGDLYVSGQSVIEVARAHGMTYAQVRKLLATNGTPIRNASERLKGRTRKAD
jgi:transposase-like protein